uniref:Uncharacterized protein n=1 Tax=Parastrongyloides trichosuri TaxID=131310 RepID=A0A0N4ZY15_PARTI
MKTTLFIFILFLYKNIFINGELSREELIDYLKYKQETRSTFDGRIDPQVKPIGYVGGKPIWPRIIEDTKSLNRLFFDDSNVPFETHERNIADVVHRMDREDNYKKVIQFLERFN